MPIMRPLLATAAIAASALFATPAAPAFAADAPKPLRVLLVTGGCCHDYTRQKEIIAKGLADRAQIEVTAVQQGGTTTNTKIPLYENVDWSKGYDVVIHDECFSDAKDVNWTARILAPHKAGLPAVVIHCAMHCYRDGTDEWFKFCGVTSHRHGASYPHEVLNNDAQHPIMKGFGPAWANPAGELYWISKVWPTAHPLATSKNREKGNDEVCVWTNQYEKARVFGTTLGHHNETVGDPKFLTMLTRGTLWAAGKLDDDRYLKPGVAKLDPAPAAAESARLAGVKVPDGFETTLFAAPPAVSYPVSVAAAPNGDLYVSCDRNGSLDRQPHRGSVVRLRDLDGDGRADEAKRFVADVDSPRGLVFDHDRLYLMHPPHLSAFIDHDGDGIADEQKILVKDIAFTFKDRPADHTSNGVTLGIDGWLYLAIGDFGFISAEGTDGRRLQLRGGGVVRVRPDGTGLELYSQGTRNILEVALDPLLNGFARDNTNDGGGWDIRLHHFTGLEDHGYPRLFKNFADETIAPLADYGGGSGCGGLYLSEPGFPAGYGDALYTADWGRDRVFRHKITPKGATFSADQTEFLTVPRVTDLDVDALGHLYVSSWKGATFTFAGEEVGYILRVTPKGDRPEPLPDYARMDAKALVKELESASHRRRLEAQRELVRRPPNFSWGRAIGGLLGDSDEPTRVAAVFAFKQRLNSLSTPLLADLATDDTIREYALRALTDRLDELDDVPSGPFLDALKDENPRVRRQAAASLARLGRGAHATPLSTLLADRDPVVAHTAVNALIALKAADACFAVVDDAKAAPAARAGALRVLQALYESNVADGLIRRLDAETSTARRLGLLAALARLDHREGYWRGDGWGTRPDTSGPYYQPEAWDATPRIEAALKAALGRADAREFAAALLDLDRNKASVAGDDLILARVERDAELTPAVVAHFARGKSVPTSAVALLTRVAGGADGPSARSDATIALLKIDGDGDAGLRAALGSLARLESEGRDRPGFRAARDAFFASARPTARRRLLEDLAASRDGAASAWAEAALLVMTAERRGGSPESRAAAAKATDALWSDPKRRIQLLHAVALAEHRPSSSRVLASLSDPDPAVVSAAREAARLLNLDLPGESPRPTGPKLATLTIDAALAAVAETQGDSRQGERVFARLGCANCHTTRSDETPRGPYLGTIATTYKRRELAEAILVPSKTIAQGFATNVFELDDGRTLTGFVVKEAADSVVVRDAEGKEATLATKAIVDRVKSPVSVMPEGQVKDLTIGEFSALLAYLESLAKGQPAH